MRGTLKERFDTKYIYDYVTNCMIWTASKDKRGYGYISIGERGKGTMPAYRAAYEIYVGPIPEGLELDHLCRTPSCVNPNHLEPVTHMENERRKREALGLGEYKTHCPQGHEYTEENTRVWSGKRDCRECDKLYHQQKRADIGSL